MSLAARLRPVVALALECAPAVSAHAASSPRPASVDVEVADTSGDRAPHSASFTLPLHENGPTQVNAIDGLTSYTLKVSVGGAGDDRRLMMVVDRAQPGPAGALRFEATLPWRPGTRMVLGKVKRADGRSTEAVATIR